MAKVTSKLQVTVPKAIALQYRIHPGDEIDWVAAGDVISVVPPGKQPVAIDRELQLRLFDQATKRNRSRTPVKKLDQSPNRGWRREDLYVRGRSH